MKINTSNTNNLEILANLGHFENGLKASQFYLTPAFIKKHEDILLPVKTLNDAKKGRRPSTWLNLFRKSSINVWLANANLNAARTDWCWGPAPAQNYFLFETPDDKLYVVLKYL